MKKSVLFTVFVVLATTAQAAFDSKAKKDIKAEAKPVAAKQEPAVVQEPNSPVEIVFYDREGLVMGRLKWQDKVEFQGNAEKSADAFFRYLIPVIDKYIKGECANFK
jgi:hypothetical protein